MARTRASLAANGELQTTINRTGDKKTDLSRWRMLDDRGNHTWHYLKTEAEAKEWPQSIADKWYLNLDTDQPKLPTATTAQQAATNGFTFFSKLQLEPGNWGCEYGGPMFLLPGFVITYYVTETPIPEEQKIEMINYVFARQAKDGGWGLHIEGESSVFGISMNYVALRILGVEADDVRMVKARNLLHEFGGSVNGPHWLKFWLAVLGVAPWTLVNPVPPELWLLPDWTPISPWRWWIHIRMVYLPMSFIASKKWSYKVTDLTRALRDELFITPYEQINFLSHRNNIHARDNYHPKSWILNTLNTLIVNVWDPYLRINRIKKAAEDFTWKLIQIEDKNTDYANLAPVNAPMQTLACFIQEGPDAYSFKRHIERLEEFKWMKDEGMLVCGTNGVQNWDTAFAAQAAVAAGLAQDEQFRPVLIKSLEYLEAMQTLENRGGIADVGTNWKNGYRHPTLGAWGFSNRDQGYTVSDCIAEAVKTIVTLQAIPSYPTLISAERLHLAIDNILSFQNPDTYGCSSYELRRGSTLLEYLNAAEVFGRIMVEYDYPECTTACVIALATFRKHHPTYRTDDIQTFIDRALIYIRKAQRADGSWYGAWGICFTYAGMFALESLALVGETCETSERCRRACKFFIDHQQPDGGWGETYKSCETGVWSQHENTQVVQTAWVVIALLYAEYPDVEPIKKAIKLLMERQQANGEWLQEAIEGVFNKSCMISYPNYKFEFPIKALGMFAQRYGDMQIL